MWADGPGADGPGGRRTGGPTDRGPTDGRDRPTGGTDRLADVPSAVRRRRWHHADALGQHPRPRGGPNLGAIARPLRAARRLRSRDGLLVPAIVGEPDPD